MKENSYKKTSIRLSLSVYDGVHLVRRHEGDLCSSFVTRVEPRLSGAQSYPSNEAGLERKLNFRCYCSIFFNSVLAGGGTGYVCISTVPSAHTQTFPHEYVSI
jgi:hypothetical protein